jgi:hypothetical protein
MHWQSKVLLDLQNGDLTSVFTALVTPKTNIQAPVFFSSNNNALQSSSAHYHSDIVGLPHLNLYILRVGKKPWL